MSSDEPTDQDWETTRDTLCWYLDYMRKHQARATSTIATIEEAYMALPMTTADAKEE